MNNPKFDDEGWTSINVLGTVYNIFIKNEKDDRTLEVCEGYCDDTVNKIVVEDCPDSDDPLKKDNMDRHIRKNIRHEIIHAFMFESGLGECSNWAHNEECVDWFARMWDKIDNEFRKLGIRECSIVN